MSKIKEINPSDAVLCWVGDSKEELESTTIIKKILCFLNVKFKNYRYVDTEGNWWKYAEPVEEENNEPLYIEQRNPYEKTAFNSKIVYPPQSKWSDKYPQDWSIDAKIFKAISEGAVVKSDIDNDVFAFWTTGYHVKQHQICTNYTGTDSDKWEPII